MQPHVFGHEADVALGLGLLARHAGGRARAPCRGPGRIMPIRIRIVVDFPAPFGPTKPMIWPASRRRRTSDSWKKRYALSTPSSSRTGSVIVPARSSRPPAAWQPARAAALRRPPAPIPTDARPSTAAERCAVELAAPQLRAEPGALGDERPFALSGDDHAFALELEIRALDGDHADLHRRRKRPDRRDLLPGRPVAHGDATPDLLHDLEIHGPPVGVGDDELTVHV